MSASCRSNVVPTDSRDVPVLVVIRVASRWLLQEMLVAIERRIACVILSHHLVNQRIDLPRIELFFADLVVFFNGLPLIVGKLGCHDSFSGMQGSFNLIIIF